MDGLLFASVPDQLFPVTSVALHGAVFLAYITAQVFLKTAVLALPPVELGIVDPKEVLRAVDVGLHILPGVKPTSAESSSEDGRLRLIGLFGHGTLSCGRLSKNRTRISCQQRRMGLLLIESVHARPLARIRLSWTFRRDRVGRSKWDHLLQHHLVP